MTSGRRWLLRVTGGAAVAFILIGGPAAGAASAHPLGNATVNRYTGALVAPDAILLDHVVDFAEIPTAQLGSQINDLVSLAERQCGAAARNVVVSVAGNPTALRLLESSASLSDGQAGLPLLRIECLLRGDFTPLTAGAVVTVTDQAAADQLGWHEMTARGNAVTLVDSDVPPDSASTRLSSYPQDLLSSPLDQRSARLVVQPGGPAGALATSAGGQSATSSATGVSGLTERVAGMLDSPGTGVAVLALAAAVGLGAAHALAPGHGKTVMAFYLVDARERSWRTAAGIGLTVTAAHTASVLALGALVTAGAAVTPASIYPWLAVASGALILLLGLALLRNALRGRAAAGHGHGHGHEHGHGHGHGHGSAGRASVLTLGIAGGLVPSPSALLLLLAAVAVGRPWFGAAAVLAFGAGMAITLSVAGLLASGLASRIEMLSLRNSRWARTVRMTLAYGTAGGVCLVGAGLVLRAAVTI